MTCKDCIHFEVCDSGRHIGEYIESDGVYSEGVEKECVTFKDKSKFIELPFIAMIEQTIIDGKPNFNKSNSSKNGMYCVVYSDPTKWASPLIDICGKTHYRTDEAIARQNELKAKQEE